MARARCPSCKTLVQVLSRDMGAEVECPNCSKAFIAGAARGGAHTEGDKQTAMIVAGACVVGGIVITLGCFLFLGGSVAEPSKAAVALGDAEQAKDLAEKQQHEAEVAAAKARFKATKEDLDVRSAEFVKALAAGSTGSVEALNKLCKWPRMHDASPAAEPPTGRKWDQLSVSGQAEATQHLVDGLIGDADTRDFMSNALVLKSENEVYIGGSGRTILTYQDKDEKRLTQKRTIVWAEEDARWYVIHTETEPVKGRLLGSEPRRKEGDKPKIEELLAKIAKQKPYSGAGDDTVKRVDELVLKLVDLSLTTEHQGASAELAKIGKAAVPALLNVIVDHVELTTDNDLILVNQIVQTLRDVAKLDYRFIIGPDGKKGGASYAENVKLLAEWFTWWELHR